MNNNDNENTANTKNKTLVVYYSAQNHTKRVAEQIANKTGADIFEVVPKNIYTEADLDWTDRNSRVTKEHDDESLQNIELTNINVPNWEDYDTVYIGYPIWWGIAAWPINNFVKGNDFTGKKVIPFCTSTSSGVGRSDKLLKEMTNTGDWSNGHRFYQGVSEDEVIKWVESVN
ncbi:MAG: flavodoxin [Lachnospiraceae bacterium]|nr:flavodoxin [Lachnospiraceae bacterium]